MRRQLFAALMMVVIFTVITGLAYPLVVTGVAQGLFNDKSNGSLVENADGEVVGSRLIGQSFVEPQYFHPRPSAAGDGYDPTLSSGSNLGPTNEKLLTGSVDDPATPDVDERFDGVEQRVEVYRDLNGLADDERVPVDAVTASGSGLDPHISVANARLQAGRVADERGLEVDEVLELIDDHTDGRDLGFLGEEGVNVLELNMALDRASAPS
jgi:potassium-transporting ATPase KdpC subunit